MDLFYIVAIALEIILISLIVLEAISEKRRGY
jgi:hypothetical protein